MPADKLFGKDVVLSGNPMQMPANPTVSHPAVCPTCGRPNPTPKATTST